MLCASCVCNYTATLHGQSMTRKRVHSTTTTLGPRRPLGMFQRKACHHQSDYPKQQLAAGSSTPARHSSDSLLGICSSQVAILERDCDKMKDRMHGNIGTARPQFHLGHNRCRTGRIVLRQSSGASGICHLYESRERRAAWRPQRVAASLTTL
jgi:hypothetical protein